jgi:uncharacterized protein YprB with RNaseH-like and TPR domain
MRKAGGYAFSFDIGGIRQENDTFTCFHCNSVVHVTPKCNPDDLGGMCRLCMKMICPTCMGKGCFPFEKRLEQVEKRDRALRSYGI